MTDTMGTMDIAFPNLGIYLENVPQYIYIGDFGIAIYGIMIAIGMILGIIMAAHIAKKTGQDPDKYWDMSLWVIIFALIGARIYYVIFFWEAYEDDLLQIFNLRAGGLAIYGGVIAGVITAYVYSVIKKMYLPEILDTLVYGLLVGQIIGRWGNFFNREVFGEYSDNLLAMRLPIDMVRSRDITDELAATITEGTNYIQVHPTFLYESLWNLGLLIIMLLYLKHRRFKGQMFLIYLAGYGIGRAWIESIRTDQLYIPGTEIPVNLVMAVVLAVVSVVAILYICNKKKGEPPVGLGIRDKSEETEAGEESVPDEADAAQETEEAEAEEPAADEAAQTEDEESAAEEAEAEEPAADEADAAQETEEAGAEEPAADEAAQTEDEESAAEETEEPEAAGEPAPEEVKGAEEAEVGEPAAAEAEEEESEAVPEVVIFDEYEGPEEESE